MVQTIVISLIASIGLVVGIAKTLDEKETSKPVFSATPPAGMRAFDAGDMANLRNFLSQYNEIVSFLTSLEQEIETLDEILMFPDGTPVPEPLNGSHRDDAIDEVRWNYCGGVRIKIVKYYWLRNQTDFPAPVARLVESINPDVDGLDKVALACLSADDTGAVEVAFSSMVQTVGVLQQVAAAIEQELRTYEVQARQNGGTFFAEE